MYKKLVKQLREVIPWECPLTCKNIMYEAADVIEELSNERKTGEWCADYDGYSDGEPVYDMWWCLACGEYFDECDDRPTWKYCPNCGAKMSGGDEDV